MSWTSALSLPSMTSARPGCDNYYAGEIPPCLLRPWLPPYSYSTTEADNGEYRRRRSERVWRTVS